jgi:hypothetical protein
MALWASIDWIISTKAMSRGSPVPLSLTMVMVSTALWAANSSCSCCSVTVISRFPNKDVGHEFISIDFPEISQSGANVEFQKAILLQIAIRKDERS